MSVPNTPHPEALEGRCQNVATLTDFPGCDTAQLPQGAAPDHMPPMGQTPGRAGAAMVLSSRSCPVSTWEEVVGPHHLQTKDQEGYTGAEEGVRYVQQSSKTYVLSAAETLRTVQMEFEPVHPVLPWGPVWGQKIWAQVAAARKPQEDGTQCRLSQEAPPPE